MTRDEMRAVSTGNRVFTDTSEGRVFGFVIAIYLGSITIEWDGGGLQVNYKMDELIFIHLDK